MPLLLDLKSAADFADFIQKGDHVADVRPLRQRRVLWC